MIRRALILFVLFFFLTPPSYGATLEGVTFPDQTTLGDKTLLLNGLGLREATIFKFDVYVAGLYLETKSDAAQAILDAPSLALLSVWLGISPPNPGLKRGLLGSR